MKSINNVKISIIFYSTIGIANFSQTANSRQVSFFNKRNFLVIKDILPIIIFKKSGNKYHLNVTGIKSMNGINLTVDWVVKNYCHPKSFVYLYHTIDNLTAIYNIGYRLPLQHLATHFSPCNYNTERFPGLHVKTRKGAVIIFGSGKINILGYNSEHDIEEQWKVIQEKIKSVVTVKSTLLK